jgi:hypothetical protein
MQRLFFEKDIKSLLCAYLKPSLVAITVFLVTPFHNERV